MSTKQLLEMGFSEGISYTMEGMVITIKYKDKIIFQTSTTEIFLEKSLEYIKEGREEKLKQLGI